MGDATAGRGSGAHGSVLRWAGIVAVVIAAAGQLVVLVPFTLASGLVAPLWAIVLLCALWGVGVVTLIAVARRRPLAAPLVPVVNLALWWLTLILGGRFLGWTP